MGIVLLHEPRDIDRFGIGGLTFNMLITTPLVRKIAKKSDFTNNLSEDIMNNEKLTAEERKELEELRAYKQRQAQKGSNIKVSQKGAISVYGLGRFPVTLYASQWQKLLAMTKEIAQFAVDHKQELAHKEQ